MNLLTQKPPTKIKVNNKIYDINYDFRTVIRCIEACEDEELTLYEKQYIIIKNIYKEDIPDEDYEQAYLQACKFIDLGNQYDFQTSSKERTYSFTKDGNYIFSGINSTHKIDIDEKENLHWWKFMALFMDMDNECFFSELVYFRRRKAEGKLSKSEKKQYNELKNIIDLDKKAKMSKEKEKFLKELGI